MLLDETSPSKVATSQGPKRPSAGAVILGHIISILRRSRPRQMEFIQRSGPGPQECLERYCIIFTKPQDHVNHSTAPSRLNPPLK